MEEEELDVSAGDEAGDVVVEELVDALDVPISESVQSAIMSFARMPVPCARWQSHNSFRQQQNE
jgi:hypothetical protein